MKGKKGKGKGKHNFIKKYKNRIIVILIIAYLLFYVSGIIGLSKYLRPIVPKSEQEQFLLNNVRDYLKGEYVSDFYDIIISETKETPSKDRIVLFWEKEELFFLIIGVYSREDNKILGWSIGIFTPNIIILNESDIQKSYVFFKNKLNVEEYECKEIEDGYSCKSVTYMKDGIFTYFVNSYKKSFESIEHSTNTVIKNINTEIYYCYLDRNYYKNTEGGCILG